MPEHHSLLLQEKFRGASANQLHSLHAMLHQQCLMAGSKSPGSFVQCVN